MTMIVRASAFELAVVMALFVPVSKLAMMAMRWMMMLVRTSVVHLVVVTVSSRWMRLAMMAI
jgi:hypothetical protein